MGQRLDEDQRAVFAAVFCGSLESLAEELRAFGIGPLLVRVGGEGGDGLASDALEHRHFCFCLRTTGNQLHEIPGLQAAVAGHLPRSRPTQGASHRIGDLVDVLQQGG